MTDVAEAHAREYRDAAGPGQIVIAESPGRIHFLGDHDGGLFLSAGIDRYVRVAVSGRKDTSLRFYAADMGERKRTTLQNLKYKREDRWANYLKVAVYLFVERGYDVPGLNFTVCGNIPQNISLASSQAIELAATLAMRRFLHAGLSDRDILLSITEIRLRFFESKPDSRLEASPVDYLIAMQTKQDSFLLVDEAAMTVKRVKNPFSRFKIMVTDSKVPVMDVADEFAARRSDVKKGRALLRKQNEKLELRDYVGTDLHDTMGRLPEDLRRRCTHVVREAARVWAGAAELKAGDLAGFARTTLHSHESLRDLYEVSCPEIDWLVKRAQEMAGIVAARMTGKGFGGCIYAIMKPELAAEYVRRLEDYERIFGFHPVVYEIRPGTGAKVLTRRGA